LVSHELYLVSEVVTLLTFVDIRLTMQWRIKKFWQGKKRKTMYPPHCHLSQMHKTKYMPFIRKRRLI